MCVQLANTPLKKETYTSCSRTLRVRRQQTGINQLPEVTQYRRETLMNTRRAHKFFFHVLGYMINCSKNSLFNETCRRGAWMSVMIQPAIPKFEACTGGRKLG